MSKIENLKALIDSLQYHKRFGPSNGFQSGRFSFVTISRQIGAGGQVLAAGLLRYIGARRHRTSVFGMATL